MTENIREERDRLLNEVKETIFLMRHRNGHTIVLPLKIGEWVEFQKGAYCRPIPIKSNGMSFIEWEFTEETLFDYHDHPSLEIIIMLRGKFDIFLEDESKLFSINSDDITNNTGIIPANIKHKGTCSAGSIIITKYVPALIDVAEKPLR